MAGVLQCFALGRYHHLLDVAIAEAFNWVRWWHVPVAKHKPKPKPKAKSKAKGKKKAADPEPEEEAEEAELRWAQLWSACNQVSIAKACVPIAGPHMLKPVDGRIPQVYGHIPGVDGRIPPSIRPYTHGYVYPQVYGRILMGRRPSTHEYTAV